MPETISYITFWADRHHPVRVINAKLDRGDCTDGGIYDWHLARYCEHLEQARFPGSRIIYSWGVDHLPTSRTVVEQDTAEYLEWCEKADEDCCVL